MSKRPERPASNDNEGPRREPGALGARYLELLAPLVVALASVETDLSQALRIGVLPAEPQAMEALAAIRGYLRELGIEPEVREGFTNRDALADLAAAEPIDWIKP